MTAALTDYRDPMSRLMAAIDGATAGLARSDAASSDLAAKYLALGMSYSGQQSAITALQAAVAAIPPSVVLPGKYTITGASGYPALPTPATDNLGLYAVVVDLFGEKEDKVLCSRVGASYFWQPVRPNFTKTMDVSQDRALSPLLSPSTLFLTGGLAANVVRKITLPTLGVWPGQTYDIAFDGVLGLAAGLNILGTGIGSAVGVLTGSRKRFSFEWGVGWKQFT